MGPAGFLWGLFYGRLCGILSRNGVQIRCQYWGIGSGLDFPNKVSRDPKLAASSSRLGFGVNEVLAAVEGGNTKGPRCPGMGCMGCVELPS